MHEIYDCDKRVYVPTIYEPVRESDRVFVLRDGVVYEWDNTVTEQIAEDDLRHFNPTNLHLVEDKVSVDDILAETATGVVYQSNDTNPDKTESFLFKKLVTDKRFWKLALPELDDSQFGISDLAALGSILFALVNRNELPLEASKKIKESCHSASDVQAAFWLGRKEKDANRLLTAWFAVSKLCEQLKAAKVAKQAVPSATPAPVKAATNPVVPSVTPAEADKS